MQAGFLGNHKQFLHLKHMFLRERCSKILVATLLTKENTKNPQLAQVELVETRSAFKETYRGRSNRRWRPISPTETLFLARSHLGVASALIFNVEI